MISAPANRLAEAMASVSEPPFNNSVPFTDGDGDIVDAIILFNYNG